MKKYRLLLLTSSTVKPHHPWPKFWLKAVFPHQSLLCLYVTYGFTLKTLISSIHHQSSLNYISYVSFHSLLSLWWPFVTSYVFNTTFKKVNDHPLSLTCSPKSLFLICLLHKLFIAQLNNHYHY